MQPVYFVEKLRDLLYLVDDDIPVAEIVRQLLPKQLGVLHVAAILLRFEKIDPNGVRVRLTE